MEITENFDEGFNSPFATVESIPRKVLPMFFLIDTSGSMAGEKIGSLNTAMEEVLLELRDMSSIDADIKVAVLEFSSGCKWQTASLVSVDSYGAWETLKAGGVTDMGAACLELDKKLSRNGGFMTSASGSYAPIIFIMSDGVPVDDFNKGLAQLQKNNWFKAAMKIALAIGEDADEEVLTKFTGNRELVATVNTKEQLTKMIKTLSITSAQIGSKSRGIGAGGEKADPGKLSPDQGIGILTGVIKGEGGNSNQPETPETPAPDSEPLPIGRPDIDLPMPVPDNFPGFAEPEPPKPADPDDPFGNW